MKSHKWAIIPVIVTIVSLIPFSNKAFHLDDPLFVWAAKHIQTNPGNFYNFNVNWYGSVMSMPQVTKNPPIDCYYIAFIGKIFGWGECILHLAFLIPAAMAAIGTYYLAGKFCSRPVIAAIAAVLTPVFLVSSSNVMCDTMMLAFWVWAVFFWVKGIEKNKALYFISAAILITMCALTKYFGIALLALLPVYSIMKKRKAGKELLFLLIPVIILAGYQLLTLKLYGRGLLSDASDYATKNSMIREELPDKAFTGVLFTGGCVIIALFYSPLLWSKKVFAGGAILTILSIIVFGFIKKAQSTNSIDYFIKWDFVVHAFLMAVAGVSILWLAGEDFWRNKNAESLMLALWVFGTFMFATFVNWTINGRSVLPMVPAVGILLMRRIEQYKYSYVKASSAKNWAVVLPLIPAAIIALSVCWADYTFAGTSRIAAEEISKHYADPNRPIWFEGHWGFQYYMQEAGCNAIDYTNMKVGKGDIVVVPKNNTNIRPVVPGTAYEGKIFKFTMCRWLTTMTDLNKDVSAGFYANMFGMLPYIIGPTAEDEYRTYIVK